MAKLVIRMIFGALGLWAAAKLVPGIHVRGTETLIIAAALLGVVNAIVRPIVTVLTLPLTIVTLGLFLLVVNAAMIGLVSMVVPGFEVRGLVAGVLAAIVTGVVSWMGGLMLQDFRRESR
ncbi:phage holin family protein [Phenylobacterium sp.]|uniref:phage holin family protein n=1 Tax=Phenylobacterium sp. TaxID=1871053 RepID=UPI002F3FD8FF